MKERGYASIGLHMPKNSINIGKALRSAHCYGASMMAFSGRRYRKAVTDTSKAFRHIPTIQCDDLHDVIPYDCVPVAIDLVDDARNIVDYTHPERAFYVFGPEDGKLGKNVLDWCRDVVYIPMYANCLNLGVAVSTVLYDRYAKRSTSRGNKKRV